MQITEKPKPLHFLPRENTGYTWSTYIDDFVSSFCESRRGLLLVPRIIKGQFFWESRAKTMDLAMLSKDKRAIASAMGPSRRVHLALG